MTIIGLIKDLVYGAGQPEAPVRADPFWDRRTLTNTLRAMVEQRKTVSLGPSDALAILQILEEDRDRG